MSQPILDVCCGSRMFHFDKQNQDVVFADIRELETTLCDGRRLEIKPDIFADFRHLPFADKQFKLVIFDPPHLVQGGDKSWLVQKYGRLDSDWQATLRKGFAECFRVLDEFGVLVFKWNETQIPVSEILKLTPQKPIVGHKSGKSAKTHWLVFMKMKEYQ